MYKMVYSHVLIYFSYILFSTDVVKYFPPKKKRISSSKLVLPDSF